MEHKNDLDFNAKLYGKQKFGFRKLSIGLVAVALGTTFFLSNGQPVHADVQANDEQATSSEVEKSDQNTKNSNTDAITTSSTDSTLKNKSDITTPQNKSESQGNIEHQVDTSNNQTQHNEGNVTGGNSEKQETSQDQNKQSNSNDTTIQTQSISLKDLEKSKKIPVSQFYEEKPSRQTSVSAEISINQGKTENPTSVQGTSTISITTHIDGQYVPASNSTFNLNIGGNDVGDFVKDSNNNPVQDKNWAVLGYIPGSAQTKTNSDGSITQVTYNGNGNFSLKQLSNSQDINKLGIDLTLSLKAQNVDATTQIPVTISYNNKTIISKTVNIQITHYQYKTNTSDLAHIWTHGLTTANAEHISTTDSSNPDVPTAISNKQNILQYMLDWNWGNFNPLQDADFTQTFSGDQKLLPDTIKVYRVYQNAINKSNSTGIPDTNDIYNWDHTGHALNEDPAFEEFLRKNLYVSNSTNTYDYQTFLNIEHAAAQRAQQAYNKAQQAHENGDNKTAQKDILQAQKDMDSIPTITKIQFHVAGPFRYTNSDGNFDWSKNYGNNTDTTKKDPEYPHASFFIQMDTLLPTDMPISWVIPGDGPSSTITTQTPHATVSSDGDNGTTIYTGFNNGFSGWSNPEEETAKLYFADVTDNQNVKDLDNVTLKDGSKVPNSLDGSNENGATIDTQIKFDSAQDVITQLENNGYTFVGISNGEKTSGIYDGSSRYLGGNYHDYLNNGGYGNYSFDTRKFTLNFIKTTVPYTTSKIVHEQTTYVYENGPKNNYVENGNRTTQFSHDDEQSISIIGTGTQYQDGSNQTVTSWSIDGNGTFTITVPTTDHSIDPAYAPDYSRIIVKKMVPGKNTVSLTTTDPDVTYNNNNNGTITITVKNNQNSLKEIADGTTYSVIIPYYSKKVVVHYIDEDTIDPNTGKNKEFRKEDEYIGQPGTNADNNSDTNISNYIFDSSASNGGDVAKGHSITGFNQQLQNFKVNGWLKVNPIHFDNSKDTSGKADLTYETDHYLYFYHATHTDYDYRSVKEHVSYYYENGPKQGQQVPSQFVPKAYELNFVRSRDIDSVTSDKGSWSNWTLDTSKTNNNDNASFKVIPFSDLYQQLDDNYKLDPNGTFKVSDNTGKDETEHLLIVKGANGSIKAISFNNDEITALANGSSISIQVPYKVAKPTTPPQPSQPTEQPTQPTQQPIQPTEQPSQPTQQPTQPTKPVQPTQQPSQPTTVHHKSSPKKTPKKTPKKHTKKPNKWSTNNNPHGEHGRRGHKYNYNNGPKGERTSSHGYSTNTIPKGERTDSNNYNSNVTPKGTSVITNGINNVPKGQKLAATKHNQNTLPQTGENKSSLGLFGLCFAAIAGLIGLAVDRKKRNS